MVLGWVKSWFKSKPNINSDVWQISGNEVCYQQKEGRPFIPYGTEHKSFLRESCGDRGFDVGLYDNGQGFTMWGRDNSPAEVVGTGVREFAEL